MDSATSIEGAPQLMKGTPRTAKVVKLQLPDNSILEANLVLHTRYRSFLRAGACFIELQAEGVGKFSKHSNDYFGALIKVRRELEAKGIRLLCWGARKDVWPSGMQRDMGAGMTAFQLLEDGTNNPDARSIFEFAAPETVGTVDEQKANAEAWYRKARGNL
jgi:hypothetical protein